MKKISKKKSDELNKLVSIDKIRRVIEILRDPDGGCPWDLKQDYSSIAPYSIEEAYELVNAIEKNDINEIKSELGDLLLQVVLISQIASDQGDFNFDDVADEISQKIIRRHPQIFDENYKRLERDIKLHFNFLDLAMTNVLRMPSLRSTDPTVVVSSDGKTLYGNDVFYSIDQQSTFEKLDKWKPVFIEGAR